MAAGFSVIEGTPGYPGQITSATRARVLAARAGTGVLWNSQAGGSASCKVTQDTGADLYVAVTPGSWVIAGYFGSFGAGQAAQSGVVNASGQYLLAVPPNTSGVTRYDRVVAQITPGVGGTASFAYLTGGGAPPAVNGSSVSPYQISLAQVVVANGATGVSNANIVDERFSSVGGVSAAALHATTHLAGAPDPYPWPASPEGAIPSPSGTLMDITSVPVVNNATIYTVPAGFTLHLTAVQFPGPVGGAIGSLSIVVKQPITLPVNSSLPTLLTINIPAAAPFPWYTLPLPLPVQAGGTLNAAQVFPFNFRGRLTRATGNLSGIVVTPSSSNPYTVPSGSWMVVLAAGAGGILINSAAYTPPWTDNAGHWAGLNGALSSGNGIDANGFAGAVLKYPIILSPGTVLTGTAPLFGYLWPQV